MSSTLSRSARRWLPVAAASSVVLALGTTAGVSAQAADDHDVTPARHQASKGMNPKKFADVQLLTFNDFHGHLAADEDHTLEENVDPKQRLVGGAAYLTAHLKKFEARQPKSTIIASDGDLVGGSTFMSGLFQDEPSVMMANRAGVDVAVVGNHEFDEGVKEFRRMRDGGCHPEKGCFKRPNGTEIKFRGANFPYLAANVVNKDTKKPLGPATMIKKVDGVKVGFIGVVTTETAQLVNPAGMGRYQFVDELSTVRKYAKQMRKNNGVATIVVLLHEGGETTGTFNSCKAADGRGFDLAAKMYMDVDMVVEGHTHYSYTCYVKDPLGRPRLVTSAASFGDVFTESHLVVNRKNGQVDRGQSWARNHLVTRGIEQDASVKQLVSMFSRMANKKGNEVVGTVSEDITGDANGDRGIETPMADLLADAILEGTDGANEGGAQLSFMNVGGVRDSFRVDEISGGEKPGEITYAESYDVAPFGNILVTVSMTGQDIVDALDQQYDAARSRPLLAMGVSDGFTYTWVDDDGQPGGSGHADPASLKLNGEPMALDQTYRVSTLNFLADGGDGFTAFTNGTDRTGGPEDLANLVTFLKQHPDVAAPADRVDGL